MLKVDTISVLESIEKFALDEGVDYIDSCLTYCERNGLDVEQLATLIKRDSAFKAKIQAEAEDINVLKKTARLPGV